MTLRLPTDIEIELRTAAEDDRRSLHQTILLAIETFLAVRETTEVMTDPEALRTLAEAHQAVIEEKDITYGVDAVQSLAQGRQAS